MKKIPAFLLLWLFVFGFSGSASAAPYTGADIELNGIEYSARSGVPLLHGDWCVEDGTAIAAREGSFPGIWVQYKVTLTPGNWVFGVNVINSESADLGPDPEWFPSFHFDVNAVPFFVFGFIDYWWTGIAITASDSEEHHWVSDGSGEYIDDACDVTVTLTWTDEGAWNDIWDPIQARVRINSVFFDNLDTAPVPVPSTMLLLGSGFIGLVGFRRKWRKA